MACGKLAVDKEKLTEILEKAIEKYNKYRAPEAIARVLEINEDSFLVEFRGPFYYTCGFYDYFDDFKYVLLDLGLRVEVVSVKEIGEGAIVEYCLR